MEPFDLERDDDLFQIWERALVDYDFVEIFPPEGGLHLPAVSALEFDG